MFFVGSVSDPVGQNSNRSEYAKQLTELTAFNNIRSHDRIFRGAHVDYITETTVPGIKEHYDENQFTIVPCRAITSRVLPGRPTSNMSYVPMAIMWIGMSIILIMICITIN